MLKARKNNVIRQMKDQNKENWVTKKSRTWQNKIGDMTRHFLLR